MSRTLIAWVVLALVVMSGPVAGSGSPSPGPDADAGLPVIDPREPLVLVADHGDPGGLFVRRQDGSGERQLATDILPGVHNHPDWSPDGQHVAFIDEATGRMWIAHLDGSPTESVPACDTPGCDYPAWSPDGSRIAFSRAESADDVVGPPATGLYVLDLASGAVTPVVRLERPLLVDVPRWSPDGTQLVFGVDQMDADAFETGAAIAIVPASGGEPRFLTDFDSWAYAPDWGWVTDEIVYGMSIRALMRDIDVDAETWDVFGIQPDGSGLRQITQARPEERFRGPRWTPDGSGLTAFLDRIGGDVLIDPTTGSYEPFATGADESRALVRPLPASD